MEDAICVLQSVSAEVEVMEKEVKEVTEVLGTSRLTLEKIVKEINSNKDSASESRARLRALTTRQAPKKTLKPSTQPPPPTPAPAEEEKSKEVKKKKPQQFGAADIRVK